MTPPISIDGTDITGATIDDTDVQEITVDGDTVFSAGPSNLPVAYSDLVAWYPFDSGEYGGSNADDVTAIIGGSGDDTAYDGTVSGATYQSSGGVTDINAGANSGAFDFDGSNDNIDSFGYSAPDDTTSFSFCGWFDVTNDGDKPPMLAWQPPNEFSPGWRSIRQRSSGVEFIIADDSGLARMTASPPTGLHHAAFVYDSGSSTLEGYIDGTSVGTDSVDSFPSAGQMAMSYLITRNSGFYDGILDDIRVYETALSSSQVTSIYNNTKP